ncbi:MAG: winged helix-turn-helix domain-containing protein [Desulfobulbaceae bacterium]|nr:winged helix-turn-helix domain-containing protein [Desulfobulbaceae bacterium]
MISLPEPTFLNPTKTFRRLSVLLAIHQQSTPSQHKIAKETRLSSSMVNTYIKTMVNEGFITISNRNNRDYNYNITETGNRELMALLLGYSTEIVQLFSQTKKEIARRLTPFFQEKSTQKIILFGASETCEIVMQALEKFPQAKVIRIADSDTSRQHSFFHNYLVIPPEAITSLAPDYIIITSFAKQDEIYQGIKNLEQQGIKILKLTSL